eukprot:COSAG01_NODE_3454_length_6075_cov_5.552878_9_plen_67_part_00
MGFMNRIWGQLLAPTVEQVSYCVVQSTAAKTKSLSFTFTEDSMNSGLSSCGPPPSPKPRHHHQDCR